MAKHLRRTLCLCAVLVLLLLLPFAAGPGTVAGEGGAAVWAFVPTPFSSIAQAPAPPVPVGPAGAPAPTSAWQIEGVDVSKYFADSGSRSLAVDAAGHPRIAYGDKNLYYAWYDGVTWTLETIDATEHVGRYTSLALGPDEYPAISYCVYGPYPWNYDDWDCQELRYAHYDGTAWRVETADSGLHPMGSHTSLALDAAGKPHISYLAGQTLRYAHFDGTTWLTVTVDSGSFGWFQGDSLALDAAGLPHISYAADGTQRYAYFDGTSWHRETLPAIPGLSVGGGNSLALDAAGRPHISCVDYTDNRLWYAHYDGSAWQIEVVGSDPVNPSTPTSLALDAAGRPHIAYPSYGLRYARYDGTAWLVETVDDGSTAPIALDYVSLAMDGAGRPHVSYYRLGGTTPANLCHAVREGGTWSREVVDTSREQAGSPNALAIDVAGRPHIVYCRSDPGFGTRIHYAYFDGASWQYELVAPEPSSYFSMALDGLDQPHVIYTTYIADTFTLHYAYRTGTTWVTEVVSLPFGNEPVYPTLALDAADRPHLAYDITGWGFGELYHAFYDGTTWQTERILRVGCAHWPSLSENIVIDQAGNPAIAYSCFCGFGCHDVSYAYYDGTNWNYELVASYGSGLPALTMDGADRPHVAFVCPAYDGNYNAECYAYRGGTSWITETVQTGELSTPSLAVDAAGRPRIAYSLGVLDYYSGPSQIRYARRVDGGWQIETVTALESKNTWASLALDPAGYPHIAFRAPFGDFSGDLLYASNLSDPCIPLNEVQITGPSAWSLGVTARYTATTTPLTATSPVTFVWTGGQTGTVASYIWATTGTYTVAVAAMNSCSMVHDFITVSVSCQPLAGVAVAGPRTLLVNATGTYRASPVPITASLPLTVTWDKGTMGPEADYSWPATGTYTLTVTATSICGDLATAFRQVAVLAEWPYSFYLPLVAK